MLKNIVENDYGKLGSGFSNDTKRLCLGAAEKQIKFYYSVFAKAEIVMENFQRNNERTGNMRSLY